MTAVDRSVPLSADEFGERNPGRVHVIRGIPFGHSAPTDRRQWQVWRGTDALHAAATHDEAIRWAQSRAAIDKHPNATRYHFPEPMEAP